MEGVLVVFSLSIVVFGIFYLYYSTRHKERIALIEKGVDAGIFFSPKTPSVTPTWKIVILNLALLSMGVGIGIILGTILFQLTAMGEDAYPAAIFLTAGIGLMIGYFMTKDMDKEKS